MEATRAEKTRLGIFLIGLSALFALTILFLVGRKLFTRTDEYYTRMRESVTGLQPGSTVKQNGLDVGEVVSIQADTLNIRSTIVRFAVARGTTMKSDMYVTLGSYGAADIPKGGEIPSRLSMIGRLAARADSIADKMDRLLGNVVALTDSQNQENIVRIISSSAAVATSLEILTADLQRVQAGSRIAALLGNAEATVADLRAQVRNSDLEGMMREYRLAGEEFQKVAVNLDLTVRRAQEDLLVSLADLRVTLRNMSAFSRQIKENPSVLLRGEDRRERRP